MIIVGDGDGDGDSKMLEMVSDCLAIIEKYELGDVVRWILENNPSQALPYHNFSHALWTARYVDAIYQMEVGDTKPTPRELVVAALFHDFDHSGGFFTDDSQNIERAIAGLNRWFSASVEPTIRSEQLDSIAKLILETRYPFHTKSSNVESVCLRDADMMQNCNDTLLANFVGIKQELYKYVSYADCIEKSLVFLRSVKYESKYGKMYGDAGLKKAIYSLEHFQRLVFCK